MALKWIKMATWGKMAHFCVISWLCDQVIFLSAPLNIHMSSIYCGQITCWNWQNGDKTVMDCMVNVILRRLVCVFLGIYNFIVHNWMSMIKYTVSLKCWIQPIQRKWPMPLGFRDCVIAWFSDEYFFLIAQIDTFWLLTFWNIQFFS